MRENKLHEIPKEWKWVRLEEVCLLVTDGTHDTPKPQEKGKPLVTSKNIKNGKIDISNTYKISLEEFHQVNKRSKVDRWDILFSMIGTVGEVAIVKNEADFAIKNVGLFKPYNKILSFWLFYFFKSPIANKIIQKNLKGTTQKYITLGSLRNFSVVVSPLPEQQKIVDILEEAFSKIDTAVEGLKKIKKLLSLYRQSVLKYAFEGKLTQKWREENKDKLEPAEKLIEKIKKEREERYKQELEEWKKISEIVKKEGKKKSPKPKPPKELPPITEEELKNLPQIPKEWEWVRFGKVLALEKNSIKRGPFGSAIKKSYFVPDGYKVYEQKNVIYQNAFIGNYYINESKFEELKDFSVREGDFLVSCSGTIGKIFQLPKGAKEGVINQALLRLRINLNIINNKYFLYFFSSPYMQDRIKKDARGVAIKNIASVKDLILIPIPILSYSEQQKIVEEIEYRLSIADKLEKTVDKLLKLSEKLKQSYLKYAFEGKLTEEWRKQNPHLITGENSVDKLLEKIKSEKEKFEKQKKKKTKKVGV